jgi:hypothetical protein
MVSPHLLHDVLWQPEVTRAESLLVTAEQLDDV